ncbi:MAG: response regulator [Chloroflexi bacterium]|nr:response regulator [Chloroflexota bacterium]
MDSSPIRVLLVDDDEDDIIIARDLLSDIDESGFQLDWVSSYDDGLKEIGRDQHDVYLVDFRLGPGDGLQLIRDALENGSKKPLILLTGQGDREVDVEAMRAGASDYLVKGQIDANLLERSIRYSIERKRVEAERAVLEEQLLQSQKLESVGQLAGGIAHDFNNLMTPIVGYSQMALMTLPQGCRERGYIQEIQKAAERASRLVQQLLAFSRRQMVQPKVIDLNDLIINIDKMLRRLIDEDIELVLLPTPGLKLVKIDPSQFEQVLVNLTINARDAMADGGTLIIETSNVSFDNGYFEGHNDITPGTYVMLAVSDTGVGMSKDVKTRIFEPFFTTKDAGTGTGLGLSTCYGIIAQNSGFIWVYSEPGQGTTFKIYLPSVVGTAEMLYQDIDSGHLPRGSETILLVEDEEPVREMTVRVLRQQGYNVLEAPNGAEGLRLARDIPRGDIHLLLTDVVMPLIGGKELSEKFQALHPESQLIFTSGYTDELIVRHGVLEPGVHFIQKPYSLNTLTRKVREVLDAKIASLPVD